MDDAEVEAGQVAVVALDQHAGQVVVGVDQGGSLQDRAGSGEERRVGLLGRGERRGENEECDAWRHGEWAVYHPESAGHAGWLPPNNLARLKVKELAGRTIRTA